MPRTHTPASLYTVTSDYILHHIDLLCGANTGVLQLPQHILHDLLNRSLLDNRSVTARHVAALLDKNHQTLDITETLNEQEHRQLLSDITGVFVSRAPTLGSLACNPQSQMSFFSQMVPLLSSSLTHLTLSGAIDNVSRQVFHLIGEHLNNLEELHLPQYKDEVDHVTYLIPWSRDGRMHGCSKLKVLQICSIMNASATLHLLSSMPSLARFMCQVNGVILSSLFASDAYVSFLSRQTYMSLMNCCLWDLKHPCYSVEKFAESIDTLEVCLYMKDTFRCLFFFKHLISLTFYLICNKPGMENVIDSVFLPYIRSYGCNLRHLCLTGAPTDTDFRIVIETCTNLEDLSVTMAYQQRNHREVFDLPKTSDNQSQRMKHLKKLFLCNFNNTHHELQFFIAVILSPHLEDLTIMSCQVFENSLVCQPNFRPCFCGLRSLHCGYSENLGPGAFIKILDCTSNYFFKMKISHCEQMKEQQHAILKSYCNSQHYDIELSVEY